MNRMPSRAEALFTEALAQPAAERGAFLAKACGANVDLLAHLVALVAAHEGADSILESPAPARAIDPEEAAGDSIGRYKLLQKIGEGGCGVVWMAEQEEPVRRRVALKIIKLGMDTKAVVARFEAERQALAMMDYPNIAKVHDAGATDTGRPYFVMELVRGIPITKYCDENHLTPTDRLDLFIKVCQAVQHAHQKGIIHRDLKPSNILVTVNDGAPTPKVIDFGIAKATQGRLTDATVFTQFEQFIGTPVYMSPEQAEMSSLDIDTRSDVYSLGILLYELLTGRPPFDPKTFAQAGVDQIRQQIREIEPPRPSARLRTLTDEERTTIARLRATAPSQLSLILRGDLDWIVMRCIEKDRTRRYDTANGLAMDIQRYLRNEPVVARPPSTGYLLQKLLLRHRVAFATGATMVATLVLATTASTWAFWKEKTARQRAIAAENEQASQRQQAETARQRAVEAEAVQNQLRLQAEAARTDEAEQRIRAEDAKNHAGLLLYAADMNLADQALKANRLGRVQRLLDRHRPSSNAEPDLRGWEWRYLWQQSRSAAIPLVDRNPADQVSDRIRGWSISFSPDGSRVAAGYRNGRVELWDVARRQREVLEPGSPQSPHAWAVVAFSPNVNAVAMGGSRGIVRWHDFSTRQTKVLCELNAFVRDLVFSRDGTRLVITTHSPGMVYMIDPASGILRQWATPNSTGVHFDRARLSADQQRLYHTEKVEDRQVLRCRRISDDQLLWEIDSGDDYGFTALALAPNDRLLACATGYADPTIRIRDAMTGQLVAVAIGHQGWVSDLAFSTDGGRLASASTDHSIRVWNTSSWKETRLFRGHMDEIHALALSPDGDTIASAAKDGAVYLWNVSTAPPPGGRVELAADMRAAWPLPGGTSALAYSAQRQWLVVNLRTLEEKPPPFSASDKLYLVPPNIMGVYDGADRLRLYELFDRNHRLLGEVSVGSSFTGRFAYTSSGPSLAWGDGSRSVYLVRLDASDARKRFSSSVDRVEPLYFSSDGEYLYGRGQRGGSAAWNVRTDKGSSMATTPVRRDAELPYGPPNSIRIQHALAAFQPPGGITSTALSADGRMLALGSESGVVAVYDYAAPKNHTILRGYMHAVHGVTFSPDARRLVTTRGGDHTAQFWDTKTWQELISLPGSGSVISFAAFSDDGNTLIVWPHTQAGRCQFWTVPSWAEIEAAEQAAKGSTPLWESPSSSAKRYADTPANLNFEMVATDTDLPLRWSRVGNRASSYAFRVDRDHPWKRPLSVRLDSTATAIDGFGALAQTISSDLYNGKRIRVQAWIKTEAAESAHLFVGIYRDSQTVGFDNMRDRPIRGTTDWTEGSIVLDVPVDATAVNFGLFLQGTGTAWFNDMQFEVVGADTPTTGNWQPRQNTK